MATILFVPIFLSSIQETITQMTAITAAPPRALSTAPAPNQEAAEFPQRILDIASSNKKLVYAHWSRFMSGPGGGAFTGVDAKPIEPLGPPSGFSDIKLAAQYIQDLASGAAAGPGSGSDGIIAAAIIKNGANFYPIQLDNNLVGGPGRAHHASGPDTVLMTAKEDTSVNFRGGPSPLKKGEQAHTPWGFKAYAKDVTNVFIADSTGKFDSVPKEGRAHWWNTPNSGGISVD